MSITLGMLKEEKRLIDILRSRGLLTNLKLCLDAGDGASAPSGATSWLDRSGNGYDFFRGTSSGADATDPTFNGTPDNRSLSEYWSFDGGDYFRYDAANEAWMQNLHKDNALFTFAAWVYFANITTKQGICGTLGTGSTTGFTFYVSTVSRLDFFVENAGASVIGTSTGNTVSNNAWNFVALSLDEAGNTRNFRINGTNSVASAGTYTSPSTGNATHPMEIGADGGGNIPLTNGSRMAAFAAWEGVALTAAQLDQIYQATRGRFGV